MLTRKGLIFEFSYLHAISTHEKIRLFLLLVFFLIRYPVTGAAQTVREISGFNPDSAR